MTEPLLLTATQIATFDGTRLLTKASGFFFARDERLYLVTSRHVVLDEPSAHRPDRIEIELHVDDVNLTRSVGFSVLLYHEGKAIWHQGEDSGGAIDVAVIELDRAALPASASLRAFAPANLQAALDDIEVGSSLLIVGSRLSRHAASPAGGAPGGDRIGLRRALSGPGLLSHRCAHAPRHQRRAGGDACAGARRQRRRAAVEAARRALGPHGHADARSRTGRIAGPELRVVCRHPDDAHRG
jgi:hypothetical protein